MNRNQTVLLVHGFGSNWLIMSPLALRLRLAGYKVVFYNYPAYPSEEHLTKQFLKKVEQVKPYAVIGHSLGGVMIAKQLDTLDEHGVKIALCLGSPLIRCILAEIVSNGPFGFLISKAAKKMLIPRTDIQNGNIRLGMIAGKGSSLLLKVLFPYFRGGGDGMVRSKESDHNNLVHRVEIDGVDHITLIISNVVMEHIEYFLAIGRFPTQESTDIL